MDKHKISIEGLTEIAPIVENAVTDIFDGTHHLKKKLSEVIDKVNILIRLKIDGQEKTILRELKAWDEVMHYADHLAAITEKEEEIAELKRYNLNVGQVLRLAEAKKEIAKLKEEIEELWGAVKLYDKIIYDLENRCSELDSILIEKDEAIQFQVS